MTEITRRTPRRTSRSALSLLAVPLMLAACAPSGPSPVLNENEITARTLISVFESGDTDELAHMFYGDAVYDDFPNQTQYRGLEEIAGYVTHIHDWADAVSLSVVDVQPSPTGAVVEWVFSAQQARPIGTRVPVATGRDVILNGVTILEIDGGRIRRAADYMDVLGFVLQLGAEVHMPGGSVMKLDLEPLSDPMDGGMDGGDPTDPGGAG